MSPSSPIDISVDDVRVMLERHEPVTLLDVREAADRAEWSIPGSLHADRYQALRAGDRAALDGIDLPEGIPVVTVCGRGVTSLIAATLLRERGIAARSLEGGMHAWSLAWNAAERVLPGGATIVQLRRTGKGCLSYLIGSDGEAVAIDVALDPAVFVEIAAERGWTITHVFDTHVHADHLSRSRLLAEATGATMHLPANDRVSYPFVPLHDGDVIAFGTAQIKAIDTPGHTGESMSYLVDDQALFTGDTLFLAGVGRPDLEASAAEARLRANRLWASLQRLTALPPETLVLPGHTSMPVAFDGELIAAPLREVVAQVSALQRNQDSFVAWILAQLPPPPPNHAVIVALNEAGDWPAGDPVELEAGANRCAVG